MAKTPKSNDDNAPDDKGLTAPDDKGLTAPDDKGLTAPGFDEALIRKLAELLDETGVSEIEFGKDDWHIRVAKNSGPVAVSAAVPVAGAPAPTEAPAAAHADHPGVVTSPMVGIIYMAPEPGAAAFVKVGDSVSEGDTLLTIEAMKVFNTIKAPQSGKVTQILIADGNPVEFGEPLLIIE